MTIEEVEKRIKEGILDSIYIFYGEEEYLKESCIKKISKNFGEQIKGVNAITIEQENLPQLIQDIQTPAFGYEKKWILVKNSELFQKETKKKVAKVQGEKQRILEYLENNIEIIKQDNVIIFNESSSDSLQIPENIQKNSIVVNFEFQKPAKLVKRLKAIINAYEVNVEDSTLMYLLEKSGTNLQELMSEIRKLIEYVGKGGMITKQEIDLLTTKKIDSVIFDLTDCLGKKDISSAMRILQELIMQKEPIQKIIITLYNHFKKVYIVKLAKKENKNIAEYLHLKPNQMFLTTKYVKQAEYFKEEELREILEKMIELDRNYKIGLIDITIGLETILARYCS